MERLESDMDDLFLKAGDLYPLKISESDWDGVAGKLRNENFGDQNAMSGVTVRGARYLRKWGMLLILFPLCLTSLIYTSRLINKKQGMPASFAVRIKPVPKIGITKISPSAGLQATIKNEPSDLKAPLPSGLTAGGISRQSKELLSQTSIDSKNGNTLSGAVIVSKADDLPGNEPPFSQEVLEIQLAKPLSLNTVSGSGQIISIHEIPLSASSVEITASLMNKGSSDRAQSSRGFYISILAGPDFSTVKFQSVNQVGFSVGALAGYHITKQLAIETGLFWDKKYYYSKGEYFNKSQAGISYNILSLEGDCNMFEIPITIRYDFATRKNHDFFVRGGLSSYLMKQENYNARVQDNGNEWNYLFKSDHANNYFFSVAQLSAGYELAISGKTKIRIEPYVNIPLQGIGVGSMPISSTGIFLGVTHSFH
jgi:hypothetical protein